MIDEDLSALATEVARTRAEAADYMAELAAVRWIRVMCDYSADGVWARGGGATAPEFLPVSIPLIARIRDWQAVYETFEPWNEAVPVDLAERWAAEGLSIAIEMKRQLPDWTVIYFDERRSCPHPTLEELARIEATLTETDGLDRAFAAWRIHADRYRPWFEYEVTAEVVATGLPPDTYPK